MVCAGPGLGSGGQQAVVEPCIWSFVRCQCKQPVTFFLLYLHVYYPMVVSSAELKDVCVFTQWRNISIPLFLPPKNSLVIDESCFLFAGITPCQAEEH